LIWTARHWRLLVLVFWLLAAAWFTYMRWNAIWLFALGDTDDNMRMSQVRAWLQGQGWYDLRQYRLAAPRGADIHWSRLVDLPLAALITVAKLFTTGANAERFAIAAAPLIPLLPLAGALALTARRLIHPAAFALSLLTLYFAASTNGMFMPTRIDHHGWQLSFLAIAVAGLADPRPARGGATTGIATALSLSVGLEMLIYLALAGAAQVLMWIDEREQRRRLGAYAVTLAGGTALGFLLFASYANRAAVCDALSPVWLSDALLGGALLALLAWWSPGSWKARLAGAAAAGAVVAAFHALAWPHCLSRLEGVSPEVQQLWLNNVREAKPIYGHSAKTVAVVVTLPLIGLAGWILLALSSLGERDRFRRVLSVAVIALTALLLLLWQTRAGPAAQMLGVTGCAALAWLLVPKVWALKNRTLSVFATAAVVVVAVGAAVPTIVSRVPDKPQTARDKAIATANRLCPSMPALRPVALQPRGTVFTYVDLAPRLITVTHHKSIAGPYHRNGEAIADVMKAFRGSAEQARALIGKYRADYLLTCPNMSTATLFQSAAPNGFYMQLERGQVPAWLQRVPLPADSPLKLWRVVG
jgi:hypothetical protein